MRETINNFLSQFDLDVRKTGDARFADQKCAPDVICFIADCIMNIVQPNQTFTVSDIRDSQYFIKNAVAVFGKPIPTNPTARHEYDKFIQQPLRLLGCAHVLNVEKVGGTNVYSIANEDILDFISRRERNTYNFLYCYFRKVMVDSGMWKYFQEFIDKSTQGRASRTDYMFLRDKFIRFMIGNTNINTAVEVRRIFPKILNIFAVDNGICGSERGTISKFPFTFSDLMYNRKNWRDTNKDKSITRQEAAEDAIETQQEAFSQYYIQKAIALIRKIQHESEVHDQWSNGPATHVHHIFPRSQFPQIAHYVENLILLTATQHNTKAHPNNNTHIVDKDYQLILLLAKSETIEKSLKLVGDKYYRKESFVFVINTGLSVDWSTSMTFNEIRQRLIEAYNAA